MGNRWLRAGQWIVGLAIVVFACRSLVRNWDQLRAQPLEWRVEPGWLALSAVLWKRLGVEVARPLAPDFPTLGDVDSAEALEAYQAAKRAHKAELRARATAG